jgi:hypothetical protein
MKDNEKINEYKVSELSQSINFYYRFKMIKLYIWLQGKIGPLKNRSNRVMSNKINKILRGAI